MTTQFDASTGGPGAGSPIEGQTGGSGPGGQWTPADIERYQRQAAGEDGQTTAQRAQNDAADTPEGMGTDDGDTLALLQSKASALVNRTAELHTVYGIGGEFAIKCSTEIAERQIRAWQRRSLPPHKRKPGAQFGMLDIDQRQIALACLNETGRELHMKRPDGSWALIPTAETGSIFDTKVVKEAFHALDPNSVLNRIFGNRDGKLISASNEVMAAAGWADGVDTDTDTDTDDPYAELDPPTGP